MPRHAVNLFDENGVLSKPCRSCGCKIIRGVNAVYKRMGVLGYCRPCYLKTVGTHSPEDRRRYILKKKFGITPELYNGLLEKQNGVCAICKYPNKANMPMAVDHDHRTGEIRGLLCVSCNTILGQCDDNVETLERCISYLIEHMDFEKEFNFSR